MSAQISPARARLVHPTAAASFLAHIVWFFARQSVSAARLYDLPPFSGPHPSEFDLPVRLASPALAPAASVRVPLLFLSLLGYQVAASPPEPRVLDQSGRHAPARPGGPGFSRRPALSPGPHPSPC